MTCPGPPYGWGLPRSIRGPRKREDRCNHAVRPALGLALGTEQVWKLVDFCAYIHVIIIEKVHTFFIPGLFSEK